MRAPYLPGYTYLYKNSELIVYNVLLHNLLAERLSGALYPEDIVPIILESHENLNNKENEDIDKVPATRSTT